MQARLDIPRTVWTWKHYPVIVVWGAFPLCAIVAYARKLLPLAAVNNNNIKSTTMNAFAIVAVEKTTHTLHKAVYGGHPILVYNVKNSLFPPEQVLEHLAREYASRPTTPPPTILLHCYSNIPQVPGFKFLRATEGDTQSLLQWCPPLAHKDILNQTHVLDVGLTFVIGEEEEDDEDNGGIY